MSTEAEQDLKILAEEGIKRLANNIEKLKIAYKNLKRENLELFDEKQKLLQELNEKDKYIKKLEKQIETLKITNALIYSGIDSQNNTENLQEIKHSAKIKLNQLIRDIDKVIKLLSSTELQ